MELFRLGIVLGFLDNLLETLEPDLPASLHWNPQQGKGLQQPGQQAGTVAKA